MTTVSNGSLGKVSATGMGRVRQLTKGCCPLACNQRQLYGGDLAEASVDGRPTADVRPIRKAVGRPRLGTTCFASRKPTFVATRTRPPSADDHGPVQDGWSVDSRGIGNHDKTPAIGCLQFPNLHSGGWVVRNGVRLMRVPSLVGRVPGRWRTAAAEGGRTWRRTRGCRAVCRRVNSESVSVRASRFGAFTGCAVLHRHREFASTAMTMCGCALRAIGSSIAKHVTQPRSRRLRRAPRNSL